MPKGVNWLTERQTRPTPMHTYTHPCIYWTKHPKQPLGNVSSQRHIAFNAWAIPSNLLSPSTPPPPSILLFVHPVPHERLIPFAIWRQGPIIREWEKGITAPMV